MASFLLFIPIVFGGGSCGEGQTEGATWSATLQQGLIQRQEHVDHGVGIEVGGSRIVFLAAHPPTPGRHFVPRESGAKQ